MVINTTEKRDKFLHIEKFIRKQGKKQPEKNIFTLGEGTGCWDLGIPGSVSDHIRAAGNVSFIGGCPQKMRNLEDWKNVLAGD